MNQRWDLNERPSLLLDIFTFLHRHDVKRGARQAKN